MKYTMKKTIAFLLTLVMLVNILPVSVLAEQPEEGRRGPLNAPATRGAASFTVVTEMESGSESHFTGYYIFVKQFGVNLTVDGNASTVETQAKTPLAVGTENLNVFNFWGNRQTSYHSDAQSTKIYLSPDEYGNTLTELSEGNPQTINGYPVAVTLSEDAAHIAVGNVLPDTYTVALKFYQQNSSTPETVTSLGTETYTIEATDTEGHVYIATITGSSHNVQFYDASNNPVTSLPEIASWSFKKDGVETTTLGAYEITSTTPVIEKGASVSEKVYVFEARTPRQYTVTLDYLDAQDDTPDTISLNDTYTLVATTTKGESLSADINTEGELNPVWSDGNNYILKAQSFQIQDSQGNPVAGKLENYIITYPTDMDPDDGVYHILLHEPKQCTVSLVVLGTLSGGYDYYIVAKKNGQAYAYASFTATTTAPQFASITRNSPTIIEDTSFEVVRVAKGTSVTDGSAFENASAEDKVTVSGNEMGENKITWSLEYPEDSDPNYAFTVIYMIRMEKHRRQLMLLI